MDSQASSENNGLDGAQQRHEVQSENADPHSWAAEE